MVSQPCQMKTCWISACSKPLQGLYTSSMTHDRVLIYKVRGPGLLWFNATDCIMPCLHVAFLMLDAEREGLGVRNEFSPLAVGCTGVVTGTVWARNQPMVSRYTIACLDRVSCSYSTHTSPCSQPSWLLGMSTIPSFL